MRLFAWCLIVSGLVIGSIFVSYAIHATTMHEAVWIQRELSEPGHRSSPSTDPRH
jgi:hypothetical protein